MRPPAPPTAASSHCWKAATRCPRSAAAPRSTSGYLPAWPSRRAELLPRLERLLALGQIGSDALAPSVAGPVALAVATRLLRRARRGRQLYAFLDPLFLHLPDFLLARVVAGAVELVEPTPLLP